MELKQISTKKTHISYWGIAFDQILTPSTLGLTVLSNNKIFAISL